MPSLNIVYLMGNLTRDPELRYTPGGTAVVEMGLAVNRPVKERDGRFRNEVDYLSVTAFGRQAEAVGEHLRKGAPVSIEAGLRYESWQDKSGQKRSKISILAHRVQFLGTAKRANGGDHAAAEPTPSAASPPRPSPPPSRSGPPAPPPARPPTAPPRPSPQPPHEEPSFEDIVSDAEEPTPF